jgi:hypothetical protein
MTQTQIRYEQTQGVQEEISGATLSSVTVDGADKVLIQDTSDSDNLKTVLASSLGGGGDVVGPASATDNAITRYDGTTGKLIQDSNITISDTDEIDNVDGIQFDLTPSATGAEGKLYWNSDDGTLQLGMPGGNVTLQLGQEVLVRARNETGVTITNGSVVYVSGAQGSRPTIELATASTHSIAESVIGFTTEEITNNNNGYVTTFGIVRDLDTSAYTAGDKIYLSTTAGEFTGTIPTKPNTRVDLGVVLFSNVSSGSILVSPLPVHQFDELNDVIITSILQGQIAVWDNSTGVWRNTNTIDVPTATQTGLIIQTTDDNATNNLQEWHNSGGLLSSVDRKGTISIGQQDSLQSNQQLIIQSNQPKFKIIDQRSSGGIATSLFEGYIRNTTSGLETLAGMIGVYGTLSTSPTPPTVFYMYLGMDSLNTLSSHILKIDANRRVQVGLAGSTRPSATFEVIGSEDIVQAIVKAHSTQTANLQEWQDSASTVLSSINASGEASLAKVTVPDDATTPPLNFTERSTAPSTPSTGDIYLDDGSNGAATPHFRRWTGATWEDVGPAAGAGSGDVVGPASATDNALVRFDTTTGKLIQNSGATLDDSNNLSVNSILPTVDVALADGGTGSSTASGARTNLDAQQTLSGLTITSATVATGDKVLIQDVDDSDNLKYVTAQSIADLASGGGTILAVNTSITETTTTSTSYVTVTNGSETVTLDGSKNLRVTLSGFYTDNNANDGRMAVGIEVGTTEYDCILTETGDFMPAAFSLVLDSSEVTSGSTAISVQIKATNGTSNKQLKVLSNPRFIIEEF